MEQNEYYYGDWIDSRGTVKPVKYKRRWGEHLFTQKENDKLLKGFVITFPYKSGMIRGHLQYRKTKEGIRYFGFCPDFDEEYIEKPIYDASSDSKYEGDRQNEALMNQFMRLYYYSRLLNDDGTKAKTEYIDDAARQKNGVDVICLRNNKKYVIDEKAQIDYIYKTDGPLDTFALELLNSSSGRIGWFINNALETEYYMFLWPHADERLKSANSIEYVKYALVERSRLKELLEKRFKSADSLIEYALRISKGELKGAIEKYNKLYYKNAPFNGEAYLVYTKGPTKENEGKIERPVNLVVRKYIIDGVAEEKGIIKRNDNDGGII